MNLRLMLRHANQTSFKKGDSRITGKNHWKWSPKLIRTCPQCGKTWIATRRHGNEKFCSRICYWKAGGRAYWHKREKSLVSCRECGRFFIPIRPSHTYCSYSCSNKNREIREGADNPNWKGGVAKLWRNFYLTPEWRTVRKKAFKRDNYCCQICGTKRRKLHGHHIVPLNQGGSPLDVDNVMTACERCHMKTERKALHSVVIEAKSL